MTIQRYWRDDRDECAKDPVGQWVLFEDHEREVARLRLAAQAVVDRWDTPLWKDVPATAVYINALRKELERPQ